MTVSRVLNNSGYASQDVKERVLKAASELDYRPNVLARALKRQRTRVVGVLLPDISNPFSAELASGIQEVLWDHRYSCFYATTRRSIEHEREALDAFFDHRVDGIIVATRDTGPGNEALIRVASRGVPVVVVGRSLIHSGVDRVSADHWRGAYDAVMHLIQLGHTNIGFIGCSLVTGAGLRRFQGYLDAMRERGFEIRPEWVLGPDEPDGPGFATQADGYESMKRLVAQSRLPTAVLARNDFAAMGALCAARDANIRIPNDISICGFDNVSLSSYTTPPLTTVDQPKLEQGRQAARFLLDRMEGRFEGERRDLNFPCQLIIRQSTGPIAHPRTRSGAA
jgi:DNA-binding LacI/PurR family transcriptional regulator